MIDALVTRCTAVAALFALTSLLFPGAPAYPGSGLQQAEGAGEGSVEGEGELEGGIWVPPRPGCYGYLNFVRCRVNLNDLLRTIQMFNSGAFHCDESTEDGYAPGPGHTVCYPAHYDYNPTDWQVNISELLREIQFYNMGGYYFGSNCDQNEDGACPGVPPE